MKVVNIKFKFRDRIEVIFSNKKSIYIYGEMMGVPRFEAIKESIKKWRQPNEDEVVTEENKVEIIQKIKDFIKKNNESIVINFTE